MLRTGQGRLLCVHMRSPCSTFLNTGAQLLHIIISWILITLLLLNCRIEKGSYLKKCVRYLKTAVLDMCHILPFVKYSPGYFLGSLEILSLRDSSQPFIDLGNITIMFWIVVCASELQIIKCLSLRKLDKGMRWRLGQVESLKYKFFWFKMIINDSI